MNHATEATTKDPKRDIESELSLLSGCLDELEHTTDMLEKRLMPAPQPPVGTEAKRVPEAPPSPPRSTVAQMVFDQSCKVRVLRRRISDLERIVQL